jgi:predicted nucleotidyltransferase
MLGKKSPYLVAENILKQKYLDAALVFVAGSFNRNEETEFSDIDLVVIFPKLEAAWRESFVFGDL